MSRSSVLGSAAVIASEFEDREAVHGFAQAVADAKELTLRLPSGKEIVLPEALLRVLRATAEELAAGRDVTVLAAEQMLTPAEVGDLLGLSRPFVVRLLDRGEIPSENLPDSSHRVVRLADVLEFRARRDRRREGLRRIGEVIESEDFPY